MSKVYRYVGPAEIKARTSGQPRGREITCPADILKWAADADQTVERDGALPATFVVDANERLLLADRRSEHVACAGGGDVLAAGEVFFGTAPAAVRVEAITNQSTGYCPEPESWEVVERVLDRLGIDRPDGFTSACVFRRCTSCGATNVVKDSWFYCDVCGRELEARWNF